MVNNTPLRLPTTNTGEAAPSASAAAAASSNTASTTAAAVAALQGTAARPPHAASSVLQVKNLHVRFTTPAGHVHAVNGIDLRLHAGQRLAIIGESGCGKSVLAQALFRLLPANAQAQGQILLNGHDVLCMPEHAIRALRGRAIGLIPQHLSALNPLLRTGVQLAEAIDPALSLWGLRRLRSTVAKQLQQVALPATTAARFAHELSGGMNRRVLIAMGTAPNPGFLVADEPTTGLDRILRARIVRLLDELTRDKTLLLITHDIEVAHFCDTLAVMYAGQIIEQGPTATVLAQPQHPYTQGLLASMPSRGMRAIAGSSPSLIDLPPGCTFHPRCAHADENCCQNCPALIPSAAHADVLVRCTHTAGAPHAAR